MDFVNQSIYILHLDISIATGFAASLIAPAELR